MTRLRRYPQGELIAQDAGRDERSSKRKKTIELWKLKVHLTIENLDILCTTDIVPTEQVPLPEGPTCREKLEELLTMGHALKRNGCDVKWPIDAGTIANGVRDFLKRNRKLAAIDWNLDEIWELRLFLHTQISRLV